MNGTDFRTEAAGLARSLTIQALWPSLAVAAALVATPLVVSQAIDHFARDAITCAASVSAMLAGLAALAASALLLFDALLFRLMASYPEDLAAGAAVDDLLVRMRLKPRPRQIRTFAERADGARRLVVRQRLVFVAFLVLSSIAVSDIRF